MSLPLPSRIDIHLYPPTFCDSSSSTSYHASFRHYSNDHDQFVKQPFFNDSKAQIKRYPTGLSPSLNSFQMQPQQHTTDDAVIGVPSRLCSVCGDLSTGIHFGGNSCESCKAFFRRSVQCHRFQNYKCSSEERCPVNVVTRKVCQYCRYAKCTSIGMKPKWVLSDQEREEKYGSRRKRFRESRTTDEDPDIYKYLTREEKLLIEDIAHAFYQSRATYSLNFPSPSNLFVNAASAPSNDSNAQSPSGEKPPSAAANLLIVPIQRLVLFARMLKDFDLFSEDDKVILLKGSAIEIMVCSSSTLFNPKTHTFTNYLSRDQRAVMDDQILPLDPLLMKLWGEDIFNRTRSFLISMCNLHTDEVASTLLVPIILFSPDRLNVRDLDLVKRLQEKYATLLRKYMNWRYGIEEAEIIYPKLLLQIINIRSLSLAHGEIIQKFMATSSVNPLVQEVIVKPDLLNRAVSDTMDSSSFTSSPLDPQMTDSDKTPSNDTESNNGSEEEDCTKKRSHPRANEYDNEDSSESNPRNIWKRKRKLSNSNIQTSSDSPMTIVKTEPTSHQEKSVDDYKNSDKHPKTNSLIFRPHDHQVPSVASAPYDGFMLISHSGYSIPNRFRQIPMRKQSLITTPRSIEHLQQLYRGHSSSANDLSAYDHHTRANLFHNSTMMTTSASPHYDDQTYENYRQHYARMSPVASRHQQQEAEHQLHLLSLASGQHPLDPTIPPLASQHTNRQSQSLLNDDEQRLLDAINTHPNKRDLVSSLLRQMNQSIASARSQAPQQEQQYQLDLPDNNNPYASHSNPEQRDEPS